MDNLIELVGGEFFPVLNREKDGPWSQVTGHQARKIEKQITSGGVEKYLTGKILHEMRSTNHNAVRRNSLTAVRSLPG